MSDIKDGGPAFPGQRLGPDGMPECEAASGMSLRDWFAGQALAGINANPTWDENGWEDRARAAYEAADAMLKARTNGDHDD